MTRHRSSLLVGALAGLIGAVSLAGRQEQAPASPSAAVAAQAAPTAGKAHLEIPDTESTTCLTCHEGLDQAKVPHAPVAGGMCAACHEFSGEGQGTKVALAGGAVSDNTAPLCVTCHDEVGTATKLEHAHQPAASGDCAMCHSPHGSEHGRLLKSPQAELCTTCHDDVGEQLKLANPHAPVKVSCAACHDPHGSAQPTKLRAAINELCLACHLVTRGAESAPKTTLFGRAIGADVVPLVSPERVVMLDASKQFGHPLVNHPVAGPKDPVDGEKPFTCLSCHLAHAANGPALQRYAEEDPSEACAKCH